METSLKTGFAQIFSCFPKNLSCPKFGGAAAPPARTPMDQGNDLMGKLAASIQIHFDAHPSSEIAEKFRSLHASVLDFQKKLLGPTGPQVFIFGQQNNTVF